MNWVQHLLTTVCLLSHSYTLTLENTHGCVDKMETLTLLLSLEEEQQDGKSWGGVGENLSKGQIRCDSVHMDETS